MSVQKFVELPTEFDGSFDYETASNITKMKEAQITGTRINRIQLRNDFTSFLRELSQETKKSQLLLSLTTLPYIDPEFYDVLNIDNLVNQIHLMAYDFENPYYSPQQAYFSSPLELPSDACDQDRHWVSVDLLVNYWLSGGISGNKLIVGIPAFGRAWKIEEENFINEVPLKADGPSSGFQFTKTQGKCAFFEICLHMTNQSNFDITPMMLRKSQPENSALKLGTSAYRKANKFAEGIWVSYDDLEFVASKARYVRDNQLGGVALVDMSLDDFKGSCGFQQFPLLRTIKAYM